MTDHVAYALQTARQVGPIPPPEAHAHHLGRAKKLHTGPLHSSVAGRTDHLPSNLENSSYVLPADHVAHLGEDNTNAGFKVLKRMFENAHRAYGGVPYGGEGTPYGGGSMPYGGHAAGGRTDHVPVAVAGGEYALGPREVLFAGMGNMDAGHRALDAWILKTRAQHIKTLKNLDPPKND